MTLYSHQTTIASMLEFAPIIPVNYPEGDKNKPWCPSTKLIQIGAQLAGVDLNPNTFCGEKMSDARYSDGAIHYLESANYYPRVSCLNVHMNLIDQMELVEQDIQEPTTGEIGKALGFANSPQEKAEISKEYTRKMEAYYKRECAIKRWKDVIFETSVSHKGDEPNPHFRQFETADDIPFEEVIDKVKGFIGALEKITGYKPMTISLHGGAKNCPQSPRIRIDR